MGILDILSGMLDAFEITRKTKSDVKSEKPEKRNYDFSDGSKMPSNKKEYEKMKNSAINSGAQPPLNNKKVSRQTDDLEK